MRHVKMQFGCGYKGRTCVGMPQFPPRLSQVFCDTDPEFDGRDYNCRQVSINGNSVTICDRTYSNFLNLPTAFQGIIRDTPYIELGKFEYKSTRCVQSYDPFTSTGLFDAFSQISKKLQFIAAYGNYNTALQCYELSSLQTPGVLIPSIELNAFATVPLQAVPTVDVATAAVDFTPVIAMATAAAATALDTANTAVDTATTALAVAASTTQQIITATSTASACDGFNISVRRTGTNKVKLKVDAGKVYTQTTSLGQPISIELKATQWEILGAVWIQRMRVY